MKDEMDAVHPQSGGELGACHAYRGMRIIRCRHGPTVPFSVVSMCSNRTGAITLSKGGTLMPTAPQLASSLTAKHLLSAVAHARVHTHQFHLFPAAELVVSPDVPYRAMMKILRWQLFVWGRLRKG